MLRKYRRQPDTLVTAVQFDLDTDGFSYRKWGSEQCCKRGDWLVDNQGDIYTVDRETFARTYRRVGPGRYAKHACVWAEVASEDGVVQTKEGETHYAKGSFLVYNEPDRSDGYALSSEKFRALYEPDGDD